MPFPEVYPNQGKAATYEGPEGSPGDLEPMPSAMKSDPANDSIEFPGEVVGSDNPNPTAAEGSTGPTEWPKAGPPERTTTVGETGASGYES